MLLAVIVFFSCSKKNSNADNVTIALQVSKGAKEFRLRIASAFDNSDSVIAAGKTDSAGAATLTFKTRTPTFAFLEVNDQFNVLLLRPGHGLKMKASERPDQRSYFEGNGAKENNYLAAVATLRSKAQEVNGRNINAFPLDTFLTRIDILRDTLRKFHEHYVDSVSMEQDIADLLAKRNELVVLSVIEGYAWEMTGGGNQPLPEELKIARLIPADSRFRDWNLFDFFLVMTLHHQLEVQPPVLEKYKELKYHHLLKVGPPEILQRIDRAAYQPLVKDYLKAKTLSYWISLAGLHPSLDSLYQVHKKSAPDSPFNNELDKMYSAWRQLSPGKEAPRITGVTPGDSTFSSETLKGKVIYVDVWATWCGPCVEGIPYMKKLHKRFENEDDLVFLSVSLDASKAAWTRKLKEETDWQGVHVIQQQQNEPQKIVKDYRIWGIPRYIIIGRDGDIVMSVAPGPSEPEVVAALQGALSSSL
jgi:thiol-disulfide isomerase/thioredoxin